jgi:hypothetical protein
MLGTFYERFADHAVELARRVIFQATGKHPTTKTCPWPAEPPKDGLPLRPANHPTP